MDLHNGQKLHGDIQYSELVGLLNSDNDNVVEAMWLYATWYSDC